LHAQPHHPLAFQQERLWFLHRLEPDSAAYNMPFLVRVDGPLLRDAVQASLDEIVRRHQSLRTRFPEVDGRPVQVVEPERRVALRSADVSGLPRERREEEAARLARADVLRPFDLAQGGLMRALLVKLDEHLHHLLFTFHHIVADSAAAGVFLRELLALYPAIARGAAATLPALPAQYTDYVAWQRDPLRRAEVDGHLEYWRSRLSGAPDRLDLPVDRRPPVAPSPRGGNQPLTISREATDSLRAVARGERTTLFVALLAALQVLLHRYSRQADIVVGIPVSDRRRVQFEPLIGFFVNTVAIRTQVRGDLPFRQLLRKVREAVLDALSHQDAPFERVVEAVRPTRTGRNPLFQVLFSFDEFDEPPADTVDGDLRLRVLPFGRDHAMVDLSVCVLAGRDGIRGHVEFAGDLFDPDTIDRLIGHLETLVGGIVADPDSRVADLPILTAAEQEQLRRWNATARDVPATRGMHRLFEAQVRRTPDRAALVAGDREVTYEELDRGANHLANLLASHGVGRGSFVGISATRSPEMVAGLLAVLKAGGAYVGLDPELGEARARFALEDLQVRVVLADPPLASVLPEGVEVVSLTAAGKGETISGRPPGAQVSDDDLAAAIYTSGSTGIPKAVGIRHGSAVSFLHWAAGRFLPHELRGVLATTSPVFDCTLFEVFTPLAWGGTVVLADSVLDLPTLSARDRVTLVSTVPSTMEELLRQGGLPAGVMTVNLAGDVLAGRLVADIQGASQVRRIFNHYGPSEATTYATGALISDRPQHAGSVEGGAADPVPTIGSPIANVEAYVADDHLNLLPVGVPGELFIGGAGLARGYLGRPALTAELFIADPWSGRSGARVYRTGDLVRYRRDGSLDFLGRRDRQVKLRGYRIELGEVEAVLEAHPGVQRAVAVVQDGLGTQRQLVAYYVAAAGGALDPAQLVAHARARLPRYMVPSATVPLEVFPLTANGKVDREALPPPERAPRDLARSEPAGTVLEAILAGVWCDLLDVDRVGLAQDFFDIGGNSLRMVALASRLEELLGVRVLLSDLLSVSTVRDLASLVSEARPNPVLARVGSTGQGPPLFLAYPGGASFFGSRPLAARLGRAVVGLLPQGLLGGHVPRTVEDMAERHLRAVLSVQASGPYLVAGLGPGGALAYELSRRLAERDERVLLLGLVAAAFPDEGGDEGSAAERPEAIGRRFGIDGVPLRAEERVRLAGLWRRYRAAWARYRPQPYAGPVAWVGHLDAAASRWSQLLPQLQVVPQGHVDDDGADDRAFDALATLVGEAEAAAVPRPGGVVR
jgi:amino acid adenylation domain-containing protein